MKKKEVIKMLKESIRLIEEHKGEDIGFAFITIRRDKYEGNYFWDVPISEDEK